MPVRLQIRRGTASQWTAANPVLAEGELAAELDTGKYKIGNGTTAWNSLPYSSGLTGATGPQGAPGVPGSLNEPSVQQFAADGSVLRNLPARTLGAEALLKQAVWWIDAAHSSASGQSVSNLGWGGTALAAQLGSTTGADSNDPKYLDWSGENYIYLSGVNGNYLRVPDEAALNITGDLDLRCYVDLDGVGNDAIISKFASGQQSYQLFANQARTMALQWTTDGTTSITAVSTVAVATWQLPQWVRATLDVDNGAGAYEVKFYTSPDGATWTQLGATVTGGSTTSVFAGTSEVRIGAGFIGGTVVGGNLYRAQVFNGINGTPVLDIDTSVISSGSATSFSALTGQTVTIKRSTGGRKAVAVTHPCWLFGTDDYMEVADNDLIDFGASDSFTVLAVVRQWATVGTDRVLWKGLTSSGARYGIFFNADGNMYVTFTDGTNSAASSISGTFDGSVLATAVGVIDRSAETNTAYWNGAAGTPVSTSAVGSVANSSSGYVGVNSTNFPDMEFIAAAIFRRALTSDEISTLTAYFQGRAI